MRLAGGILALTLIAQCVYANTEETNFVSKIARTIEYVEKNQDVVWPGFNLKATPVLIDFGSFESQQEHIYAFNYKPGSLPWQKMKMENQDLYYLDDNLIDPQLFLYDGNFFNVESQRSFIDVEIKELIEEQENFYNKLTLNRAMLYLKSESKLDSSHLADLSVPYDRFYDNTNVKLLFLENAALTAFLTGKGQASESALQDAAAVHMYRTSLLNKDMAAYEYANEMYNGIPAYISWQSMNLNEADYINKTHLTGCRPLSLMIGMNGIIQCAMVGNPSFTSTSYGHALDQKLSSSAWKKSVETEYKTISDIAQQYYQLNAERSKALAEKAMANPAYNYSRVSSVVDEIINPYVEKMNAAIADYRNEAGVELYSPWIFNYFSNIIDSMFGNPEIYLVNTNSVFRKDFNGEFSVNENQITLSYKHLSAGYVNFSFDALHQIDNNNSWSVFKLADESKLTLDGEVTTVGKFLRAKQRKSFNMAKFEDAHMDMTINVKGSLDASDGSLKLLIPSIYVPVMFGNHARSFSFDPASFARDYKPNFNWIKK